MHVDIARLASRDSTGVLKAETGKLDIKDMNLVFYLSEPIVSLFKLAIMT